MAHLAISDRGHRNGRITELPRLPNDPHVDNLQLSLFTEKTQVPGPDDIPIGRVKRIQLAAFRDCQKEFLETELIAM